MTKEKLTIQELVSLKKHYQEKMSIYTQDIYSYMPPNDKMTQIISELNGRINRIEIMIDEIYFKSFE